MTPKQHFNRITKLWSSAAKSPAAAPSSEAVAEICGVTGLRPIDQFTENDVFIVGYPKSGNTWMQYLLAGAFYGLDLQVAPDSLIQDMAPDVHFKKFFKPWFPVTFFKSHFLPRADYRKVVYLLRDGRDVMVSYWHYLEGLTGEKRDFLELVRTGNGLFPCKWHEHVAKWQLNPYAAQMITVRYEDLKKDPAGQLRRIGEFAGLPCDSARLQRATQASSFEAMRQRETTFTWENPQIPKNKQFIRRGQIGSHQDEMPSAVREAFLSEASAMMRKTGYLA
ncbi:MAG: sulfotransferase domain-containing protein [Limisphaerales bacterium]